MERKTLADHMTKKFMATEYRDHREAVLFDKEKSQLPTVMPYLEAHSLIRRTREKKEELIEERNKINNKIRAMVDTINLNEEFLEGLIDESELIAANKTDEKKKEKDFSARGHCPRDGCNSFIGAGWACVSCDTKVCRSCLCEVGADPRMHACRPEDLESVKIIRSDCKPCPVCRVRVFRVSGCAQMHCTACRTNFDWKTMNIIRGGFFHNPHYAAWQQSRTTAGGQRGDGCVDFLAIRNKFRGHYKYSFGRYRYLPDQLEQMCKRLIRILTQANELSDMNAVVDETKYTRNVRETRINYMTGSTTEAYYRSEIQRMDKAHSKAIERAQICDMYGNACRDILTRFVTFTSSSKGKIPEDELALEVNKTFNEVEELRVYTNKSIVDLGKWYGHRSNPDAIRKVKGIR
jgi:hypothetical protein